MRPRTRLKRLLLPLVTIGSVSCSAPTRLHRVNRLLPRPLGEKVDRRGGGRGAQPRARKAVLAWADTRNGSAQHDFTSHALAVIERLGYETGCTTRTSAPTRTSSSNQPLKTDGDAGERRPEPEQRGWHLLPRPSRRADRRSAEGGTAGVRERRRQGLRRGPHGADRIRVVAGVRRDAGRRYGGHLEPAPGAIISEEPRFQSSSTCRRRSPSTTSSIRRRRCRATRCACCCGSTFQRCADTELPDGRRLSARRGRKPTARVACSKLVSRTPPRPGTSAMSRS